MPGVIATIPKFQFSSAAGAPLVNGTLTTYLAGTTTLTPTWQDQAQTTLNANPVQLDSRGECVLWLDPALSYKFILKNSSGVQQWPLDNITGNATNSIALAADLASTTDAAKGSALVGYNDALAYADGTVGGMIRKLNQTQSGQFYSDLGSKVQRLADRLFVGDAVAHDGKQTPVVGTWVKSVSSGIYEYLERAGTLVAPAYKAGIGIFGPARSSTGAGGAGDASIGVAGFAYNDFPAGAAGVWALYGTSLRASGVGGATHGIEVDIANAGALVQLYPSAMFLSGQTHGAWICSGGESTATAGLVGVASLAIGIISNDPAKVARFDKGIVFENKSISGTDGVTGNGIAIAFAARHQQLWFNNSNQVVGELVCNAVTGANALRLDMSDFGLLVQDRTTGATNFQVEKTASAANYLTAVAKLTTNAPQLAANGSDTNIDLFIAPKGTGVLGVTYGSTAAAVPGNFSAQRYLGFKDGNNTLWYIPISTVTW